MTLSGPLLRTCFFCASFGTVTATVAQAQADPTQAPVVLREDQLTTASLSPDGRFVAAAFTIGHTTRIELTPVADPAARTIAYLGAPPNPRVTDFVWAHDGTLVFATEDWVIAAVRPGQSAVEVLTDPSAMETTFSVPVVSARTLSDSADTDYSASERLPRIPRLRGPNPTEPHAVIIESVTGNALDNADIRTHSLDTRTGEISNLDWERINHSDTRFLSDAAGRLRLITERVGREFTGKVRLDTGGRLGKWTPLDRVLPADWAASFAFALDDAHRQRSQAIAFGPAPNQLIFASNLPDGYWSLFTIDLGSDEPPAPYLQQSAAHSVYPRDYGAPRPYGRLEQRTREALAGMIMTDFAPNSFPAVRISPGPGGQDVLLETAGEPADPVWRSEAWSRLTTHLDRDFPGRRPVVLDWSTDHRRWLVRFESAEEPARVFLHDLDSASWVEYYRTSPAREWTQRNRVEAVTLSAPSGDFRARLIHPHAPRVTRPPLVCLFSDEPWESPRPSFNPVAHYFADAGALVLELEAPLPLSPHQPLPLAPDALTASRVETVLTWLDQEHSIRPGKMATVGWGFGGWLSLRVAQLLPDHFDATVALNHQNRLREAFYPPKFLSRGVRVQNQQQETLAMATALLDGLRRQGEELLNNGQSFGTSSSAGSPSDPFDPDETDEDGNNPASNEYRPPNLILSAITQRTMTGARSLRALESQPLTPLLLQQTLRDLPEEAMKRSLVEDAEHLPAAVLLGVEEGNPYLGDNPSGPLVRALRRQDKSVERWMIDEASWSRDLTERTDVWHHVAAYLAANLYNYDVQLGPAQRMP